MLLATGGCRAPAPGQLAVSLGHTLEPPVPSLFTFHIATPWLRRLAGVSVAAAEVSVPGTSCASAARSCDALGLSGPAILRLSAWGARNCTSVELLFPAARQLAAALRAGSVAAELESRRDAQPPRYVVNTPLAPLTARLWEQLVLAAGVAAPDPRWSSFPARVAIDWSSNYCARNCRCTGKSLNKDEFVTCGGVRLGEVNFKTMESRICPGLYFAGELLDIDGITGGFNFQAAWTTGWIAGRAMAGAGNSAFTAVWR